MIRLDMVVADAAALLRTGGIRDPRREARLLAGHVLGLGPATVFGHGERPVADAQAAAITGLARRRAAGTPLSRLLGEREFWSLTFALGPDTLDPRPDSETVVAAALDRIPDSHAPLRLVDFGTGTGCLLLALLHELPRAVGLGVDRSEGAARTAAANARRLGLADRAAFMVGDWAGAVAGPVDLVVGNPPYIRRDDLAGLDPAVAGHDPALALDGGVDGLDAYRVLLPAAATLLAPGGVAVFEVGRGQDGDVAALGRAAGLSVLAVRADLAGIARAVVLARDPGDRLPGAI